MTIKKRYGRKLKRIGQVDFFQGKMHFYFGQTECEHCTKTFKIYLTPDEFREFSQVAGTMKPSMKARFASRVEKWASSGNM